MSEAEPHLAVPEGQSSDLTAAISQLLALGWSVEQAPGKLWTLSHRDRSRARAETDLSDAGLPRDVIVAWAPAATARADDPFPISGRPDARDVFLAPLVVHLQRFGAKTVSEMTASDFGWFNVRYNEAEVVQLVDQARRLGLVAPLAGTDDAPGRRSEQLEWEPTDRGRGVRTARGSAPAT